MSKRGAKCGQLQKHYPDTVKDMARWIYEMDGSSYSIICAKLGISHINVVYTWKKAAEAAGVPWIRNKFKDEKEKAALNSRLVIAEKLGIGEMAQMVKTKELMDATIAKKELVEDKKNPGKIIEKIVHQPDWKTQNEGIKRAMELTGTKIERKEVEHTGSQEIVHHYKMPQRQDIRDYSPPQLPLTEVKQVPPPEEDA